MREKNSTTISQVHSMTHLFFLALPKEMRSFTGMTAHPKDIGKRILITSSFNLPISQV